MVGEVGNIMINPLRVRRWVSITFYGFGYWGPSLMLCRHLLHGNATIHSVLSNDHRIVLGDYKDLSHNSNLLHLRKAYKNQSLDMNIKNDIF